MKTNGACMASGTTTDDVVEGLQNLWCRLPEDFGLILSERLDLDLVIKHIKQELADGILPKDTFPVGPIVARSLEDIRDHIRAISLLQGERTSLLHVRQVEETSVILRYLIRSQGRWTEFGWRWKNFGYIHGIRNHVLGLGETLDPTHRSWYQENFQHLKEYFDQKLTNDLDVSVARFKSYTSWFYPVTIKQMFEEVGEIDSYLHTGYSWGSHFTHVSPLDEVMTRMSIGGKQFGDLMVEMPIQHVTQLAKDLLSTVINPARLSRLGTAIRLHDIYRLARYEPARFAKLCRTRPAWQHLVRLLAAHEPEIAKVEDVLWKKAYKNSLKRNDQTVVDA